MEKKSVFELPVRVYYEDTDAGKVVYHASYLKFLERARSEWLRDLGFSQTDLKEKEQNIFAVKNLFIQYHKPAYLDDLITVNCRLTKIKKCSLYISQEIYRVQQQTELLVSADVLIACIQSKSFKPTAISSAVLEKISSPSLK